MDYSVFDSLIDAVFIINNNKEIIYCNESAATIAESSVRRLTKNQIFHKVVTFSNDKLFTMPNGDWGKSEPTNFTEVDYQTKSKSGKIQVSIQPAKNDIWVVVLHDVTLEERLHSKYHLQLKEKEEVIVELEKAHKKLEDYSKNLEKMVAERTEELNQANLSLKAIMNSLGQGFLIFDSEGICGDIYTRACLDILEVEPAGKNLFEVLNLAGSDKDQLEMWVKAIFLESLPFDSLKELGPELYEHSEKKHIALEFYPIRNNEDKIINIVLVATDKTSEYDAQIAMEKEKQYSKMILKLIQNKKNFKDFIRQCHTRIDYLIDETSDLNIDFDQSNYFRILHTLEGEAGIFGAEDIRQGARESQSILKNVTKESNETKFQFLTEFKKSIINLKKIFNQFLENNSEAFDVIGINQTEEILEIEKKHIKEFKQLIIDKNVPLQVREQFEEIFIMESLKKSLKVYNDLLMTVSSKQGKLIHPISFSGDDLRVEMSQFEPLISSLVHAFRNIIDHGIEIPGLRLEKNKDRFGHVEICMEKLNQGMNIIIKDDGAGISVKKIRDKLQKMYPDESFSSNIDSDEWVLQQIFRQGFSSRDEVGEYSGRGVGMDAIKSAVEGLHGRIFMKTQLGLGSELHIFIPHNFNRLEKAS